MARKSATFYAFIRPKNGGHTRLLSRGAVDLMKALRGEGIKVLVEPDDGSPIEYLVRKGEYDLLRDPLFLLLLNIPISVFTSLLASWLSKRRSRGRAGIEEESNIVVGVRNSGKTVFYNHKGREVSEERAREIFGLLERLAAAFTSVGTTVSPYPNMPFPICLEHTSKIVGWARVKETAKGLKTNPGVIEDEETWRRIESGELRGMSISGVVTESECSICGGDYSICNHISGGEYDGKECINTIKRIELCEISIVRDPVNPDCVLSLQRA